MTNKATRTKYVRQLDKGEVSVLFTKVGTKMKRRMRCTRNLELIPTSLHPTVNEAVTTNVIPVFDLDKNGWRSFDVDTVLEFEGVGK